MKNPFRLPSPENWNGLDKAWGDDAEEARGCPVRRAGRQNTRQNHRSSPWKKGTQRETERDGALIAYFREGVFMGYRGWEVGELQIKQDWGGRGEVGR